MKDYIDLIYVNFFNYREIKNSIDSLHKIVDDLNFGFNIFVFDNSFNFVQPELIQTFNAEISSYNNNPKLSIKFIPSNSNIGFGKGCNLAVNKGNSNNIIIINPDTNFQRSVPDSFNNFIKEKNDMDVIIGPKILNTNGIEQSSCFSFDPFSIILKPLCHIKFIRGKLSFLPSFKLFKKRIDRISYKGLPKDEKIYVDWVSGCFMLINRNFYEEVNGFDDRFFLYFEDVDLCRKARQMGKNVVYDPQFSIIHEAAHQSRKGYGILNSIFTNKASRYHINSWLKYILKWRKDFLYKLIYKIKGKKCKPNNFISDHYDLDFSNFSQVKNQNKEK